MDLKSGTLFWPDRDGRLAHHPRLRNDLRCDVAILGAGLTGALAAYTLAAEGFDVVVLDKRDVARGSTSASTALLLYEIDTPLSQLTRLIGKQKAERSYRLCRDAIFQIEEIANDLPDPCDFARKQSLYLASARSHVTDLKREYAARKRAGFRVEYLPSGEVWDTFGFAAPAAILSAEAAQIDPYRFAHRLLERAIKRGARVFGKTEVTQVELRRQGGMIVHAAGKHKVTAQKIIIAAGYESDAFIHKHLLRLRSTYAIATEPVETLERRHQGLVVWETARPYMYLRTTPDQRILIGGEDEPFEDPERRDALIPQKTRRLGQRLRKLFAGLKTQADYSWTGTFGETKDGLPYIGTFPRRRNVLYALCYGANGTNFAMLSANIIRDWARNRRHRDASIFSLER